MAKKPKDPLVCLCNGVTQARVEAAIAGGATSLGRLFDETQAGVGACGGSCQPTLKKMIEAFTKDGAFPTDPRPTALKRRRSAR